MTINVGLKRTLIRTVALSGSLALGVGLLGCSAPSSEQTTLHILFHTNPATDGAFKELTADFEAANPDIKVDLQFTGTADYASTRTARLAAEQVDIVEGEEGSAGRRNPDFVTGIAESDWVRGIESGQWVDLTDEPFVQNFTPSVMEVYKVDGKVYQIPTFGTLFYTGLYYNKEIFENAGLDVPTTWDDFVDVLDTLKQDGITPIVAGGKDQWPVQMIADAVQQGLFPTTEDKEALNEAIWTGSAELNDDANVEVLEKLQTIYSYMDPNFAGVDYATAEGQFTSGQAAMIVDGTWAIQQFTDQNPALQFGYFPLPSSNNAEDNVDLGGKLNSGMAIPASAPSKEAALRWVAFYADPANYEKFIQSGGLLPVQPNISPNPLIDSVLGEYLDRPFQLAWAAVMNANPNAGPNVAGFGYNYLGLAPMGSFTSAQAAQDAAQADWLAGLGK